MSIPNHENERDYNNLDIYQPEGINYPVIEATNNALIWPEGPKGNIDIVDSLEVSSVPEDPNTPLENIETLAEKGVVPN